MYMYLNANRGMFEYGILTLGGFAVDPGYSGRLMFGLYNYSSTPFTLIPGEKLVGAVFYLLDEDEIMAMDEVIAPRAINKFPPRLISIIDKYSPIGLTSLEDSIKAIKEQMDGLRQEVGKSKDELSGSVKELKYSIGETTEPLHTRDAPSFLFTHKTLKCLNYRFNCAFLHCNRKIRFLNILQIMCIRVTDNPAMFQIGIPLLNCVKFRQIL